MLLAARQKERLADNILKYVFKLKQNVQKIICVIYIIRTLLHWASQQYPNNGT